MSWLLSLLSLLSRRLELSCEVGSAASESRVFRTAT